jgi:serine protease Do
LYPVDQPADRAGLQEGDVIVKMDGKEVRNFNDFRVSIANKQPGTRSGARNFRDGDNKKLDVTLGELDAEQLASDMSGSELEELKEELGFTVDELTDNIRRQLNLQSQVSGVVVSHILTRAAALTVRDCVAADVISQVAGTVNSSRRILWNHQFTDK